MSYFKVENARAKVTNEPKIYGKLGAVPVSFGFKQKDGTWVNLFAKLLFRESEMDNAAMMHKGDVVIVSGDLTLSKYNDKDDWGVWVTGYSVQSFGNYTKSEEKPAGSESLPDHDIPF